MACYVFFVGGVYSGVGKGIACASLALLAKFRGLRTNLAKQDPYLNTNAGTIRPGDHGEVFVTADAGEWDQDIGTYERLTGIEMTNDNIITGGKLLKEILCEEEDGGYLGQTIQTTPHLTNKIIAWYEKLGQDKDLVFIETGGCAGDAESYPFLEAIRQFRLRHPHEVMVSLVAPVLWVDTIQEWKTKPLQNAVKILQSHGIQPDMLLCRGERDVPDDILDKVSNLTNVTRGCVFEAKDVRSVYEVPILMWEQKVDDVIADRFRFPRNGVKIHKYKELVERYLNDSLPEVEIAIVGKYKNQEAYVSLYEALYHAGLANNVKVNRRLLSAEELEHRQVRRYLDGVDGVIVPGGFDARGCDGKIRAIRYAREKKIPFLGICLGLQCAAIEVARNVCHLDANSQEFDPKTPHPVVHFVPGQEDIRKKSGTMRLGAYPCDLVKESIAWEWYRKRQVVERHRHRYEINEEYRDRLAAAGFKVSGVHPGTGLIEVMELDHETHPYFVGTQAHPEFSSRLGQPNPLFVGLVAAAVKRHVEQQEVA